MRGLLRPPDGTDPGDSYGYPTEIPWEKIERFLVDIGLDPVDPRTLTEINISHQGVRFHRYRVRETSSGTRSTYTTPGDVAEQITTCRIVWPKPDTSKTEKG
jgi:hypothetical protein